MQLAMFLSELAADGSVLTGGSRETKRISIENVLSAR